MPSSEKEKTKIINKYLHIYLYVHFFSKQKLHDSFYSIFKASKTPEGKLAKDISILQNNTAIRTLEIIMYRHEMICKTLHSEEKHIIKSVHHI